MEHSFNIEIAKKYGINSAILLNNIYFWIKKNKANNENFYDNNYWTYNSKKAFAELFPYMNERQIDYALKKLIDDGIIITGNYNKIAYDRTLWYAITKKGYCILQNCEMEQTKLSDEKTKIVEPIPDNKQDIKPNIKEIFDFWNLQNIIIHKELKQEIIKQISKAMKEYSLEDIKKCIERYSKVLKDKDYYFDTKWTLIEFLKQKNAMPDFTDEGSKWLNYINKKPFNKISFQSRKYTQEEAEELFDDIDKIEL